MIFTSCLIDTFVDGGLQSGCLLQFESQGGVFDVVAKSREFRAPGRDVELYTTEQRRRRDASPWTTVQAILAPVQFLAFLVSVALIWRYFATGEGLGIANASIVLKTLLLYTIMVTGSIWEKDVFGRWLFADAFFWEDAVSMLVLALHTAYLACLLGDLLPAAQLMLLALAAYAAYAINATQFILKLRAARLSGDRGVAGMEPAR